VTPVQRVAEFRFGHSFAVVAVSTAAHPNPDTAGTRAVARHAGVVVR
jgi:hypothetical protein